jgi:hypothetical protein
MLGIKTARIIYRHGNGTWETNKRWKSKRYKRKTREVKSREAHVGGG